MFEIGFWELVLIGAIALVVLGPERLPGAARTAGLWIGRARAYVRQFTSELEREVQVQETREQIQRLAQDAQKVVDKAVEDEPPSSSPPPSPPAP